MDTYLLSNEPYQKLQQPQIVTFIESGISMDLVLIAKPREDNEELAYFAYCNFQDKTAIIVTQRGSHRYYTNLDRAVAWARRIKFRKIHLFADLEEIDQQISSRATEYS